MVSYALGLQRKPQSASCRCCIRAPVSHRRQPSWRRSQVIAALNEGLEGRGIEAKVIYSGGADVDILASKASKGAGLQFLLGQVRSLRGAFLNGC